MTPAPPDPRPAPTPAPIPRPDPSAIPAFDRAMRALIRVPKSAPPAKHKGGKAPKKR